MFEFPKWMRAAWSRHAGGVAGGCDLQRQSLVSPDLSAFSASSS